MASCWDTIDAFAIFQLTIPGGYLDSLRSTVFHHNKMHIFPLFVLSACPRSLASSFWRLFPSDHLNSYLLFYLRRTHHKARLIQCGTYALLLDTGLLIDSQSYTSWPTVIIL